MLSESSPFSYLNLTKQRAYHQVCNSHTVFWIYIFSEALPINLFRCCAVASYLMKLTLLPWRVTNKLTTTVYKPTVESLCMWTLTAPHQSWREKYPVATVMTQQYKTVSWARSTPKQKFSFSTNSLDNNPAASGVTSNFQLSCKWYRVLPPLPPKQPPISLWWATKQVSKVLYYLLISFQSLTIPKSHHQRGESSLMDRSSDGSHETTSPEMYSVNPKNTKVCIIF